MGVTTGLEIIIQRPPAYLRNARVGLLCHQASVNRGLQHAVSLFKDKSIQVTALFAPEHGLWGIAQDQIPIEKTAEATLPVYSLYGDHRYPSAESLANVDVLICDLQDIGSRYYTFIWTMALAMQACAKYGKRFVVLDRPNPLNGQTLEGPVLDPEFASFVGLYTVPVRHGLTISEVALWVNSCFEIGAQLDVIAMKGWKRAMTFDQTGLPWVLPSPNMPSLETAWIYPGGCLIEGTQLSEGRGTTHPFEMVGAPYIEADRLAESLNREKLPGLLFRAARFEPTFHKFQGQMCGGVQVHVTDRKAVRSFVAYLTLIQRIRQFYPESFAWRPPPYEYETEKLPFDILCGNDRIREALERGDSMKALGRTWDKELAAFDRQRKPFLLYN